MRNRKSPARESRIQRRSLPRLLPGPDGLPVHRRRLPSDLKDVGDVRRLAGHIIEIHGPVKLYDGRAEIILNRVSQITGGSTLIPPLPKDYDVENRGHYSPGRIYPTKKPAKTTASPNTSATYGNTIDAEEPQ